MTDRSEGDELVEVDIREWLATSHEAPEVSWRPLVNKPGTIDAWLDSIHGLDRSGWWKVIVCPHGDALAKADVIGVVFDHAERGDLHWAPRVLWLNREGTLTRNLIHLTQLDEDETRRVRADGAAGLVRHGYGSINTECSLGHTARFTREEWDEKIRNARESSALVVDVFR